MCVRAEWWVPVREWRIVGSARECINIYGRLEYVCGGGWFFAFSPCGYMLTGIWQRAIKSQLENHKIECGESRLPSLPLCIPVANETCGSEWGDSYFLTSSCDLKHLGFLKTELLLKNSVNQSRVRSAPSVRRVELRLAFGKNWLFSAQSQAEKRLWTTVRHTVERGIVLFCPCVKKSISFQLELSGIGCQ